MIKVRKGSAEHLALAAAGWMVHHARGTTLFMIQCR
jgi:hypothetical protein